MASVGQGAATVQDYTPVAEAQLSATQAQLVATAKGSTARALAKLTPAQKSSLQQAVQAVQTDMATAIDMVRQRRARMTNQMKNLRQEKNRIAGGTAHISTLYLYAEPAIAASAAAAQTALLAKQGSDLVYARLNEVEYQMSLITLTDLNLAQEETNLTNAINGLDQIVLSLG